jgi:prepilin-type N-terminal cleavage/methylation domain-containing protein
MRPHRHSSPAVTGFSLLEVLVASAVLAIVLTILLGALSTSLSLWRTTEGKVSADREARAAELLIAQDLANVVMPVNSNLWPRVKNNSLQFLTLKSADYQGADGVNVGDVCFVEYSIDKQSNALKRLFYASQRTFDEILDKSPPGFPEPGSGGPDNQLLATNILSNNRDAVRGLAIQNEAPTNNFIVLDRRLLPPASGDTNPPAAVEVNFAVADPDAMANKDLWENTEMKLRNAGLYSFRMHLPLPTSLP